MKHTLVIAMLLLVGGSLNAQVKDSGSVLLNEVHIKATRSIMGMGHMADIKDNIIYAGQKNEVLHTDSMDANTAQDNPRQILGRVPGSNYSETEGMGFPSNGIGFRGLNPTQSIETNTRQNGYNIAGDVYGYPESYYLTPLEATDRIEVIRGASALQFGPQFGGVVNYVVKDAPADKPFEYNMEETTGSYGLLDLYNSIGGTKGKWDYFAFLKAEYSEGERPNSQMEEASGFARIGYKVNDKLKLGVEYSMLRDLLHMPGGLDDAEFNQNPNQSFRSRNWLVTPWNLVALTANWQLTDKTSLSIKSVQNFSERTIVWRSEAGGPDAIDSVSVAREVEHEYFHNSTTEARLGTTYNLGRSVQTLAAGVRFYYGWMERQQGGIGSAADGPDFKNYTPENAYANQLDFTTLNIAPFIENTFRLGSRFSVTPGIRFEIIRSTATGQVTDTTGSYYLPVNEQKTRSFTLAGVALQYKTTPTTELYGNITQAYTPIAYSFLYPMGLDKEAKIDPNLKDVYGYNADLGYRGNLKKVLTWDVSTFFMAHNNNIAIESGVSQGVPTFYETNVGDAHHAGVEAYVEVNLLKALGVPAKFGNLSAYNSFAYDDARYVNGIYSGNLAEYAPKTIERFGISYSNHGFSTTFSYSHTDQTYSDANNTVFSPDAEVGIVPAYTVMDWSGTIKYRNANLKFGVNNLTDAHYFTFRTVEYPGPGIIPSVGRTAYIGFGFRL